MRNQSDPEMATKSKLSTANLILDIMAEMREASPPVAEVDIQVICKATGHPREQTYKLLRALQQLDAVMIDPKTDKAFLTEAGYAMARPGDVTWPLERLPH